MGQFLTIKDKTGMKEITIAIIEKLKFAFAKYASNIDPVINNKHMGRKSTKKKLGSWSGRSSSLPLLVKNLPSLNLMPLKYFRSKISTGNAKIKPSVLAPKTSPNQNIKFQKLSLFFRDRIKLFISDAGAGLVFWFSKRIKFCTRTVQNYWFKISSLNIPNLVSLSKAIVTITISFLLSFSGNCAIAKQTLANHALKETELELKNFIKIVEKQNNIPRGLLVAIAKVESNYRPYAINVAGKARLLASSNEAAEAVKAALTEGTTNVDIGIMQLNYRWHQEHFNDVEEMLNPKTNIKYAGELLSSLFKKHGSWHIALRHYHSATPEYHRKYSRKVVMQWLQVS
jgi:hypothetical protein